MGRLGPTFVRIAVISTVLAVLLIGIIVVSIYIFITEKPQTQCEISTSRHIEFTQIGSTLLIQWDINETCIRNYEISLSYKGEDLIVFPTDDNNYVYTDLDYCAELTVVVVKETVTMSKTFLPENIGKINGLQQLDGKVIWKKDHFRGCRYKVKINDGDESEFEDFFDLPQNLDTCKAHLVTITPFNDKAIGESTSEEFQLEIGQIFDLNISNDKMEWDNTKVENCTIKIQISGYLDEDIPSGENSYQFNSSLEYCTQYEINITAIENTSENSGKPFLTTFENAPKLENFEVTSFGAYLAAVWEDSYPKCVYSIELNGDKIDCKSSLFGTFTCLITSIKTEPCNDYYFEILSESTNGEEKYVSGNYSYTPVFNTINFFAVIGENPVAVWQYVGQRCDYEITVNEINQIPVSNNANSGAFYNVNIPIEKLDLCKSENEFMLMAKYEDKELGKSNLVKHKINSELIKIEDLTMDLNDKNQLVATWKNVGDTCSYDVKYEGYNNNIKNLSSHDHTINLDEHLGFTLQYCATHTVTVNVKDNANSESADFTKEIMEHFEALDKITSYVNPHLNPKVMQIAWELKEEFEPCAYYYMVLGYIDSPKPDMEPVEVSELKHVFLNIVIEPNITFYVEIQPFEKTDNANEDIKGSTLKCSIEIGEAFQTYPKDCTYDVNKIN